MAETSEYTRPEGCNYEEPERTGNKILDQYEGVIAWTKHLSGCPAETCRESEIVRVYEHMKFSVGP